MTRVGRGGQGTSCYEVDLDAKPPDKRIPYLQQKRRRANFFDEERATRPIGKADRRPRRMVKSFPKERRSQETPPPWYEEARRSTSEELLGRGELDKRGLALKDSTGPGRRVTVGGTGNLLCDRTEREGATARLAFYLHGKDYDTSVGKGTTEKVAGLRRDDVYQPSKPVGGQRKKLSRRRQGYPGRV